MAVSLLNFKCNLSYRSMTFKLDKNLFFETYPAGLFLVPRDPSLLQWCTCLQRAEHILESFTSIIFFLRRSWDMLSSLCIVVWTVPLLKQPVHRASAHRKKTNVVGASELLAMPLQLPVSVHRHRWPGKTERCQRPSFGRHRLCLLISRGTVAYQLSLLLQVQKLPAWCSRFCIGNIPKKF